LGCCQKQRLLGFGGGSADIDLDASVILFDENKQVVDVVYFGQLRSKDGSIVHSGDNLTGAGDGDDEVIREFESSAKPCQVIGIYRKQFPWTNF
jgi:stress response protein SCP2